MSNIREARFAKAYLTGNPHSRFNVTADDMDLMADPSSWTFIPPSDTDTVVLSADVSAEDKSITIRPTSPFTTAHKFNAISLVTNLPVPCPTIRYFEVTIDQLDSSTCTLAIGLSTAPYPYFGLPGLYPWSIALHSTEGDVCSSVDGESTPARASYAQKPIRAGDTIGVGLDTRRGSLFFTRNGSCMRRIEGAQVPKPAEWIIKPCIGVSVQGMVGGDGGKDATVEPCV
ncbi:hypothetical protein BCR44DRAFT_1441753 [Catenaria anguillulae PL171]|uniref:B30.2/SPRY domain-containing protein n=1 Tax=Catenaria anguillulae PL171 TaxID=765915 RepID=A0A1Y2HAS2_9FUNG|nr:hypothetical protein BCR44DRAFT_1441753 [Catenaria anguillulae PL171]